MASEYFIILAIYNKFDDTICFIHEKTLTISNQREFPYLDIIAFFSASFSVSPTLAISGAVYIHPGFVL